MDIKLSAFCLQPIADAVAYDPVPTFGLLIWALTEAAISATVETTNRFETGRRVDSGSI